MYEYLGWRNMSPVGPLWCIWEHLETRWWNGGLWGWKWFLFLCYLWTVFKDFEFFPWCQPGEKYIVYKSL